MHKTEGANNSSNRFVNGPPGTTMESNWCNAVQDEIRNVIEGAGLTLDTAATETGNQLKSATDLLYGIKQGEVKGWVQFDGTGVVAIADSFNVTSIADNGVGNYTVNWTTPFLNNDYAATVGSNNIGRNTYVNSVGISTMQILCYDITSALVDSSIVMAMASGDQ